jgi:Haem-binding domain
MRKVIRAILVTVVVVFAGLQFFGPAKTNPPVTPQRTLHAKVPIPEDVHKTLSRSCWNCHSRETVWPWYSYVAPMSWMVVNDVNEAREHMDFTDWDHSPEEGADLMDSVCTQVKKGKMPLREYTWMHRSAKLTENDVKQICTWANATADQLMSSH